MKNRGFTLIELLSVVAIIGLLASIAIPSYREYVQRSRATEATALLSDMRIRMERYFQDNRTYAGGPCTPVGGGEYFVYSCPVPPDATTYILQAVGKVEPGLSGYVYTVNQNNDRTSSLPDGTAGNCWLIKKHSTC